MARKLGVFHVLCRLVSVFVHMSLNTYVHLICIIHSCWAHATASSVDDRVKIARKCQGDDINLSIQYVSKGYIDT